MGFNRCRLQLQKKITIQTSTTGYDNTNHQNVECRLMNPWVSRTFHVHGLEVRRSCTKLLRKQRRTLPLFTPFSDTSMTRFVNSFPKLDRPCRFGGVGAETYSYSFLLCFSSFVVFLSFCFIFLDFPFLSLSSLFLFVFFFLSHLSSINFSSLPFPSNIKKKQQKGKETMNKKTTSITRGGQTRKNNRGQDKTWKQTQEPPPQKKTIRKVLGVHFFHDSRPRNAYKIRGFLICLQKNTTFLGVSDVVVFAKFHLLRVPVFNSNLKIARNPRFK